MEKSDQTTKTTTVELINRKRLWFLLPIFLAPFFGLFLYSNYNWWMSICLIVVGVIQLIGVYLYLEYGNIFQNDKIHILKDIKVDQLDEYANKEKCLIRRLQVFAVVIGLLDLFPFFCQFHLIPGTDLYYEGGIIVTLLSLILCGICFWCAYGIRNPKINENQQLYNSTGKTQEDELEEKWQRFRQTIEQEKQAKKQEKEQENKRKEEAYGVGFIEIGYGVVINDTTNKIFINSHEYNFDDILEFSVQDNSVTIHSGSTSTAKTNTGSMIGRAAVGSVLLGGAGAVIGGATAKRDIYNSGSSSSIYHDYSVIITVNNITSPNEIVKVGNDGETLNKITSTLTVILHNN